MAKHKGQKKPTPVYSSDNVPAQLKQGRNTRHFGNYALYEAMFELRRSSASQPHETVKFKGTRRVRDGKAIREYFD